MDKQILNFTVNEQVLVCENPIKISTNKVNYIQAHFDLGENWSGYDSVRAVWFNDFNCISTVLDSLGNCVVPFEVMKRKGNVKVNLVGSISEDDVLTDRLTSYPVVAVIVDCTAQITGANTSPITPSEYEQFVAVVHEDAERAEAGATASERSAQNASDSATSAHNSAESAHDDKVAIEEAIAEVIQQIEDFEQVQVVVNTLPPSSQATSDFTDGVLTLGIPQGVKGDTGNGIQSIAKTGTSGLVDTYTITFTDGQTTTFTVTNGAKGDTGNGISSIEKTSTVGLVDTYTITYTNGTTTTFTVTNGEKGDKGDTGEVTQAEFDEAVSDLKSELSTLADVDVSPNLLDESNTTSGYISNSSGAISVSGDWVTTDYMPVEYGKTYTFSCTSSGARVLGYGYFRLEYDENKSAITSTYATNGMTEFTPTSASTKYVRFSYHNYSYVTERCFAEGDSLSYYEYGKKTLFVKEGANSDNVKKLLSATSVVSTRNMFDINKLVDGYISNSSGAITVSGNWVTTDYFPVEYGHYYTCSNDNGIVGVYFALELDEDKTPINYVNTVTLPYTPSTASVKYLRFSVHSPATPTMVFEESKQPKSIFTPYGDELVTNKGLLYKKKWVALGDSLTEKNVSAISNYTDFISVQNHMDIVNMGVGGTGYMRGYDSSNAFYQRAVNIPTCDIITVFGSGNDLAYYSNLGDVTDNTTDTICGCINKTLDVIFANHPTTPLLVIAPTPWAGNTPDMTTGMALYCEKLEAICSRRGIAYLDLFHHSGLRPNDTTQRDLVFYSGSLDGHGDYVHPNKLGHSIIAPRIMQAMESVIIF